MGRLDAPDPTIFELSQGIGYVDPDEDTGTGLGSLWATLGSIQHR